MRFQNGCNKVVIEVRVVQFWSEIILMISNRTRAARSFDFEITRMISDQIALHSVQLPLCTVNCYVNFLLQVVRILLRVEDIPFLSQFLTPVVLSYSLNRHHGVTFLVEFFQCWLFFQPREENVSFSFRINFAINFLPMGNYISVEF